MNEFDSLSGSGATKVISLDESSQQLSPHSIRRERRALAFILLAIALFTLLDLIGDRIDGAPWSHVLSELCVVVAATAFAIGLIRRSRAPLVAQNRLLRDQLIHAKEDAGKWKNTAGSLIEGLSAAIYQQFSEWKLTDAEKDVASMLLKGLSHKEIAELRQTSEQTVRQQAASLYQKSNLAGRNELSAYFLEDLFVSAPAKKS